MKGKPMEKFDQPPPIPSDIQALIARNKREEQEKLQEAEIAGRKTGVTYTPGTKPTPDPNFTVPGGNTDPDMPAQPSGGNEKPPANPRVVVEDPVKPVPTPKRIENQPNVEGTKRKGKKGDG
jgi:hypothetical protein